ncbi:MAG: flagellar hook assembly protein FlgD [Rhodoferax sp.]
MLMGTNNTTTDSTSKYAGLVTNNASTQSDADKAQDRFLKLLVAQMNSQDPMNPMDNAQMTTQMAQINTVSGIQQLNESVNTMTAQFATMQLAQGATMMGKTALAEGNTLSLSDGVGKGSLELAGNADKVTVQVLSPGGTVLGTINLGAQAAGQHSFEWDASGYSGSATPVFKVTATVAGKTVAATPLMRSTVESVATSSDGLKMSLKNGATVGYNNIRALY